MSLFPAHMRPPEIETTFELDRVLALPRRPPVNCERKGKIYSPEAQALAEYVTEQYALPKRACKCAELGEPCITQLNPAQAWTLRELRQNGGVVGLLPVGSGKTFIGILAALAVPDCKVAILLAKPDQRLHYERAYLRLREHFRVPHLTFYDKMTSKQSNYRVAGGGVPSLHFIAYSQLSQPDSTVLLESYEADLIICDEAHAVAARTTSRTGRLLRYLAKQEEIRFCAWSGTLIKKSIRDQAHLVAHALGDQSPMPLDPGEVDAWAAVFDPSPTPDKTSQIAVRLYDAFDKSEMTIERAFFDKGSNSNVCKGFRSHLLSTPGIVSTREASVSASNYMHELAVTKMPKDVLEALRKVRSEMIRPDGDILVDKLEQARCAREVASGFYYYWAFIHGEPDELIEAWFAARKKWNKELRVKLLGAEPHMDSPLLCANAAARAFHEPPYHGELPTWRCPAWPEWRDIRDQVEPDPRVKWLNDFLARDAAKWAKDHRGIVWYQSSAFGKKIAELAGLPYHGGGPEAEAKILAEKGDRSVIASIKAHGTGRDGLQKLFHEQLVIELPSSGDIWQQLFGRLCRPGQEHDEVHTWVPLHVMEFKEALRKAKRDAQFTYNMTGNEQFLLSADMDFSL